MMECYEALRDLGKATEIREKIDQLLVTDPLAADMLSKYGDLVPQLGR